MTELETTAARALVAFLWQGTLLGFAAFVVLRSMEERSARARYAVACAFLLIMAASVPAAMLLMLPGPTGTSSGNFNEVSAASADPLPPEVPAGAVDWSSFVLWGWAAGATVFSIRACGGWFVASWRVRRGRRRPDVDVESRMVQIASRLGIARAVRLFESNGIVTPCAFGAIRPVILLPVSMVTGLTPRQVDAILAHELAHIARWDFVMNWVQVLVEALLFYHPAVWWLSGRIRQERELCCDAVAAEVCGDRVLYARALLALEERRQEFALAATGGDLKMRVARLIGTERAAAPVNLLLPAVAAGATLVLAVAMLSAQTRDVPPPPPPPAPEAPPVSVPYPPEAGRPRIPAPPPPPPPPPESIYDQWWARDMQFQATYQERNRWKNLQDSAERERFYLDFWKRRDPNPSTPQNEALDEHRRRLAYAEERFDGWNTARGRIYVTQGPPMEIEAHPQELRQSWRYQDGREYEFRGEAYDLERLRVDGKDYVRKAKE